MIPFSHFHLLPNDNLLLFTHFHGHTRRFIANFESLNPPPQLSSFSRFFNPRLSSPHFSTMRSLPCPQALLPTSKRRLFAPEEDALLLDLVGTSSAPCWDEISQQMPDRTARQCRERWLNYINPSIRNEAWTDSEDALLVQKVNEIGHFWGSMTSFFSGRSESDIKNRWYSHVRFRCVREIYSGKWRQMEGSSERKKRNRTVPSPSKNAQKILEQRQKILEIPPSKETDFWDNELCEQTFDESGMSGWTFKSEP
jgi:hypothetical protein